MLVTWGQFGPLPRQMLFQGQNEMIFCPDLAHAVAGFARLIMC